VTARQTLNVDFEATSPQEHDFHGIKSLVQQARMRVNTHWYPDNPGGACDAFMMPLSSRR
jgi:hypothetical protein